MKKIILSVVIAIFCFHLPDASESQKQLSQNEIKQIFISTIREYWDRNYQIPTKLLYELPSYNIDRNATLSSIEDLHQYSCIIDSFSGRVYGCDNYKLFAMPFNKTRSSTILTKDKIIDKCKYYINKLELNDYGLILERINRHGASENFYTIRWKRTYKSYKYEHDGVDFDLRLDGQFQGFSIFLPSLEPKSLIININTDRAKKMGLSLAEIMRKKWSIAFEISATSDAKLLIVNPNYLHKTDQYFRKRNYSNPRLAWVIEIKSKHPDRGDIILMHVWIDAENGEYLGGYFYNW